MTAITMFAQADTAYVLTDSAVTSATDGALLEDGRKVTMFHRARMAVCWTGFGPQPAKKFAGASLAASGRRITEGLSRYGVIPAISSQTEAMAALPYVLRDMHQENLRLLPEMSDAAKHIAVVVALWSPENGPMLYLGQSEGVANLAPYAFVRIAHFMSAASAADTEFASRALGRPVDFSDPMSFHAKRDGLALLEAQRLLKDGPGGSEYHAIGGRAYLTTVSKAGVTSAMLKRWPDRIGQPITPHAAGRRQ